MGRRARQHDAEADERQARALTTHQAQYLRALGNQRVADTAAAPITLILNWNPEGKK